VPINELPRERRDGALAVRRCRMREAKKGEYRGGRLGVELGCGWCAAAA
jgi:hypothetical protein